jgi:prepilin-type N-terminal cleavage/methylation domain-containing protein
MNARGLTLIEVLASIVILTILAAACLPMMQSVNTAHTAMSDERLLRALADVADSLLEEPQRFGIENLNSIDAAQLQYPVEDHSDLAGHPVSLRLLRAAHDEKVIGGWLILRVNDIAVCRWIEPQLLTQEAPTPGATPGAGAGAGESP